MSITLKLKLLSFVNEKVSYISGLLENAYYNLTAILGCLTVILEYFNVLMLLVDCTRYLGCNN